MILSEGQIFERIESGMISNYIDLETQLQANGFDITVKDVSLYKGAGCIDFSNANREMPAYIALRTNNNAWHLQFGAYLINFNEKFDIPDDIVALGYTRSSLLRMGVHIPSAVWDAGFNGYGQGMLIVNNNYGINISRDARVMQLVFIERGEDDAVYEGCYNIPIKLTTEAIINNWEDIENPNVFGVR